MLHSLRRRFNISVPVSSRSKSELFSRRQIPLHTDTGHVKQCRNATSRNVQHRNHHSPLRIYGGEIRASQGDRSLTLAPAKGSIYGTTLLAWYTDVTYGAENLASGFRLALVYDLIHISNEIPLPRIPSDDTLVTHAREVFRRWVSSGYTGIPDDHVAVYVLHDGDSLKGGDMLSILKIAADAESMTLLLGTLCVHVTGWAEASTNKNPPYGLSQGTLESPVMERLHIAKFRTKKLTDLRGKPTLYKLGLILGEDNLVPELPFKDIEPDQQDAHPFAIDVSIIDVSGFPLTKGQPG